MSDITSILATNLLWEKICFAIQSNTPPHSLIAVLPSEMHVSFSKLYGRKVLCRNGNGYDSCPSCHTWEDTLHPDLMCIGSERTAPGIDHCRELLPFLSLKPYIAPHRLAIIYSADQLSVPASNSLLKITEEPPKRTCLLLVASNNVILPTLQSRSWILSLHSLINNNENHPIPLNEAEWARWFKETRNYTILEFRGIIEGWACEYSRQGKFNLANDLMQIGDVVERCRLSITSVQDLLFFTLEEGHFREQILSGIRET